MQLGELFVVHVALGINSPLVTELNTSGGKEVSDIRSALPELRVE